MLLLEFISSLADVTPALLMSSYATGISRFPTRFFKFYSHDYWLFNSKDSWRLFEIKGVWGSTLQIKLNFKPR